MTVSLFAIGFILLSLSNSIFQGFAEAAGPPGMCPMFMARGDDAMSDMLIVLLNSRNDDSALGDRDLDGGKSDQTMTMLQG